MGERLIVNLSHENLPYVRERYPFIYLEHGRLEVDDSSVKWLSPGACIRLPAATIETILLGPGTTITHEAIKALSQINTTICWIGEDSLHFYAYGKSPTDNSTKIRNQALLFSDEKKRTKIAQRLYLKRFPETDISNCTINKLLGMEGIRVRNSYEVMAKKYQVGWVGRSFIPGNFKMSDTTNAYLTAANQFLYAITLSVIHALGYSPYIGFVHSGSPLPFVYDISDLYKEELSVDLAFFLTKEFYGKYERDELIESFCSRAIEMKLLQRMTDDIASLFEGLI